MSKYTTEVRFICETYAGLGESVGYERIEEVIDKARTKVFDFDYPIFDEAYRPILEKKILMHYYTREICEETVGLWKLRLRAKLNEIMPYYNKLYESELLDFNPLYDADYHRDGDRHRDEDNTRTNNLQRNTVNGGEDKRTSNSVNGGSDYTSTNTRDKYNEWDLYSDTPQGGIEGILGAEDEPSLEDNGYLTNARHILHDGDGTTGNSTTNYGRTNVDKGTTKYGGTSKTTDTGDTKFNGDTTEDYAEHVYGKFPGTSASKLLKEFRDTFLNIDMDVINDLKNLFFNLW